MPKMVPSGKKSRNGSSQQSAGNCFEFFKISPLAFLHSQTAVRHGVSVKTDFESPRPRATNVENGFSVDLPAQTSPAASGHFRRGDHIAVGIGFEKSRASGLQPAGHYFAHALKQLETERRIFFAIFPKDGAIEKNRACRLRRPRTEVPGVRWKQPRPSEEIAIADGFDDYLLIAGTIRL